MVLSASLILWFYNFFSESPLILQPLILVSLPVYIGLKRVFFLIMDVGKVYSKSESNELDFLKYDL